MLRWGRFRWFRRIVAGLVSAIVWCNDEHLDQFHALWYVPKFRCCLSRLTLHIVHSSQDYVVQLLDCGLGFGSIKGGIWCIGFENHVSRDGLPALSFLNRKWVTTETNGFTRKGRLAVYVTNCHGCGPTCLFVKLGHFYFVAKSTYWFKQIPFLSAFVGSGKDDFCLPKRRAAHFTGLEPI